MLRALGDYMLNRMGKTERGVSRDTCHDHNSMYLTRFNLTRIPSNENMALNSTPNTGQNSNEASSEEHQIFTSEKMAGIFMYHYVNKPQDIFYGIPATEIALRSNCTYNILLDKNINMRRYLLKNVTTGDVFESFFSEEALFSKLANDTDWQSIDVVSCQHYLYHLSTTYGRNKFTVSPVDTSSSGQQHQVINFAPIAGFYKPNCTLDTNE